MAAVIGKYITSAAIPVFLGAALDFIQNETNTNIQKSSMFTFASIIPKLTKGVKQIDTNLKLILAITVAEIKKIVGGKKVPEWADIVSAMKQNVLFEKCENSSKYGIRTYSRDSFDFFKFNGTPDESTIKDVKAWFVDVLGSIDPDLKEVTGLLKGETFESLASIVASTGASVNSVSTSLRRTDYDEFTVADVGLVRYPSYENPKAKIFRLKVTCWRRCKRILSFETNHNGLTVEIDSQEYIPRENVVSHIRDRVLTEQDVEEMCKKADSILLKINI